MKGIFTFIIGCFFIFSAPISMASDSKTAMDRQWLCTTNASGGSADAHKKADKAMANHLKSSAAAFRFAAQNCRDCTKIICEFQSK